MANEKNEVIVYLRGIAALMVCFCHYRLAWPEPVRDFAKTFGELGVQVFFVISGYIIPYSLDRAGYRWRDFGHFWLKRLWRLQPTYLLALLLTAAISAAAAGVKGGVSPINLWDFAKSTVYLTIPAENPVIWTLIVELKYYLFIAALFPLLFSHHAWVRRLSFGLAAGAAVGGVAYWEWLVHLPYFLIGFAACYVTTRRVRRTEGALLLLMALATALVASTKWQVLAGLVTSLTILLVVPGTWKVAGFYGAISYSLYLIHFPVGVKLLNLALPQVTGLAARIGLGFATAAVSTAVAYLFFRVIEQPSTSWSQRVRYRRPTPVAPRPTGPAAQCHAAKPGWARLVRWLGTGGTPTAGKA